MQGFEQVTGRIIRVTERFKNGNIRAIVEEPCQQCSGRGIIAHVKHVEGGRCFKCEGTGKHTYSRVVMTVENRAKAERLKCDKQQVKAEERAKMQARLEREHEEKERIREKQYQKNKDFTGRYRDILATINRQNSYELDFVRNLVDTMKAKPLNLISQREKEFISDFLARKAHRRGSKAYNSLYEQIIQDLNKDYSI